MSTDAEAPIYKKSSLEFKSTSFNVPVLVLFSTELKQIEHQLEEKIAQAPEFFKNSPVLIDLQECNRLDDELDLTELLKILSIKKIIPIGISGGNDKQTEQALRLRIPIHTIRTATSNSRLPAQKPAPEKTEVSTETKPTEPEKSSVENMLVSQPIRSGQRVYAKGDLTILANVSAGAEVMAEGNIHIYGSLRGRALAGIQGNVESRIFCSDLAAELVSIAGHYKISEELENAEYRKPSQVFLLDQTLIIKNL